MTSPDIMRFGVTSTTPATRRRNFLGEDRKSGVAHTGKVAGRLLADVVFRYDAAGRLVKEGDKTYRYGYLDKVLSVTEGERTYAYDYHVDGQLARAVYGNGTGDDGRARTPAAPPVASEDFLWDGLALIKRGDECFVNEPHVGGGNPVASSKGTTYFNDILGTTVGAKQNRKYSAAALTAFGESDPASQPLNTSTSQQFFTGKPHVAGLGHAFLFRNYRAGLAKWQTADPMGYPDGWNQLLYGNRSPIGGCDRFGAYWVECQASCWIQKQCSDLVAILEENSPLHTGIPRSVFSALVKLLKTGVKLYKNEHPDIDVLLNTYISAAVNEVGSDPLTPTYEDCKKRIEQIMVPLGYKWDYIGKEVFSIDYDATFAPGMIEVGRMSVLWKISYKYWKWVEE